MLPDPADRKYIPKMNTDNNRKKVWARPSVKILNIRRDTFGGSVVGVETQVPKGTAHVPKNPTPR